MLMLKGTPNIWLATAHNAKEIMAPMLTFGSERF
jgi:hypothetical protein